MRVLLFTLLALGVRSDRYHPVSDWTESSTRTSATLPEQDAQFWVKKAQDAIQAKLRKTVPTGKARNIVMFLGDGMSVPTLAASRILLGQRKNVTGEESEMNFETFPTVGLVKTYCVNSQVADSACTATSYLCGVKTNQGNLGVSAAVTRGDCVAARNAANQVESIAEWALKDGRDAGIVTTTRVTHASPSGAYAKSAERNWETDADIVSAGYNTSSCPDITHQLVHMHPGNKFKVILGGGRRTFLPNTTRDEEGTRGRRTDGRNLIEEWQQDKRSRNVSYNYVWNRKQLLDLNNNLPEYLLGLFEGTHMQYNLEADVETEPTLTELTETAIKMLSRNEKGFFLFVEGGRIDHAHHDNLVHKALDETLEMDKAIARATQLLSKEDSLIVVTSDHAHVMAFNGYGSRGRDILGASRDRDSSNVPYMTLSYTNGPGFRPHVNGVRPDVTAELNYKSATWPSHVDAPRSSETHGGDDVAVFAWGARHDVFTGLYEQHQLPHLMAYVACIGPGERACTSAALYIHAPLVSSLLVALLVIIVGR